MNSYLQLRRDSMGRFYFMNNTILRERFAKHIAKKWVQNDHSLKEISCVYAIISFDFIIKKYDIAYIGSTIKLHSRYKSHKAPYQVQELGLINLLYYLPMNTGFYQYEKKLINKTRPYLNKIFYGNL